MALSLGFLGMFTKIEVSWASQVLVLAFVCFFEFSQGPICWLYNAEIMPLKGITVATLVNWASTLLISLTTPLMFDNFGKENTFFFFGAICAFGMIFCIAFVRETKGKNADEIQGLFVPRAYQKLGS